MSGGMMADSHEGEQKEEHEARLSHFGHVVSLMKGGEHDEV
jgi:hypothetical protein